MSTIRRTAIAAVTCLVVIGCVGSACAQNCTRQGNDVTCDDGKHGVFTGDAIVWPDGTKSSLASPHPSVIVGNKASVIVGKGVMVGSGSGKGMVPMENPSAQTSCPKLDGVAYCY
ncbi:MAG TPA: hypothetical protein VK734_15310 [Bradyrhizobium sp.]|jgi:hypothetical protein|nr:hypothetical protein [Bradyrhizobium sp.]